MHSTSPTTYKSCLVKELKTRLEKYEDTLAKDGDKHSKYSVGKAIALAAGVISAGTLIGGAVGTFIPIPIPGTGSAVGTLAGATASAAAMGTFEAYRYAKFRKHQNAKRVDDYMLKLAAYHEVEKDELISAIATIVLDAEKEFISKLKDCEETRECVAKYLAAKVIVLIKDVLSKDKDLNSAVKLGDKNVIKSAHSRHNFFSRYTKLELKEPDEHHKTISLKKM